MMIWKLFFVISYLLLIVGVYAAVSGYKQSAKVGSWQDRFWMLLLIASITMALGGFFIKVLMEGGS